MIRLLTTRLQTTELQFKLERNKIMYSIYDKVVYKTTDYKTTMTTINKKIKYPSWVYIV